MAHELCLWLTSISHATTQFRVSCRDEWMSSTHFSCLFGRIMCQPMELTHWFLNTWIHYRYILFKIWVLSIMKHINFMVSIWYIYIYTTWVFFTKIDVFTFSVFTLNSSTKIQLKTFVSSLLKKMDKDVVTLFWIYKITFYHHLDSLGNRLWKPGGTLGLQWSLGEHHNQPNVVQMVYFLISLSISCA